MENSHQQNEPVDVYEKMKNTPPELRKPKEISDAIKKDIRCVEFMPKELEDQEGFWVERLGDNSRSFIYVRETPSTPEIYAQDVELDWKNLRLVPENMKTEELCLIALKSNPDAMEFVPENIRESLHNHDFNEKGKMTQQEMEDVKSVFCSIFLDGTFASLPPERRTELVCLAALQADPMHLKYVPEKYLSDELILSVLRMNGAMLSDIDENRRTPEMYAAALETDGRALMYFPKETITPECAMKAVKLDGTALEFVPENLITPELCRAALSSIAVDYEVIEYVPFPDVCLEHLKKIERNNGDVFLVFGSINPKTITPEMAQLAVQLDPSCIQFVPDHLKTPEMCADAVGKDWENMRFLPSKMRTKGICEIAMNRSIHAQQYVPERNLTPDMYMYPMKVNGLNLEYVPENHKTQEVCLQALKSNPDADEFLPKRTNNEYNIYDFYQNFKNQNIMAEYLSFEQIQKVFQGETVHASGLRFGQNVMFKDLIINYDSDTNHVNVKSIEGTGTFEKPLLEKQFEKFDNKPEKKPEKRKGLKV